MNIDVYSLNKTILELIFFLYVYKNTNTN